MIAKYLENTHATTHNQYHMELLDVFALEHEKKTFTDVGNRLVSTLLALNAILPDFVTTGNYKRSISN